MQEMNTNFRGTTLSISPSHHGFRALTATRRASLQLIRFLGSCLLLLSLFSLPTLAQVDCVDAGGIGVVSVNVSNVAVAPPHTFTATLPAAAGHTIIANSCVATVGGVVTPTCTVAADGLSVTWTGTIPPASTLTLIYRVQIAATAAMGTTLTINNTAAPVGLTFPPTSSLTIGCVAPIAAVPTARVSDQKPGSVLVFPYYTSNAAGTDDTRISMTHSSSPGARVYDVFVHVFLIEGNTCLQADFFVCLTRGASFTFTANSIDPNVTGYIIAVAVNAAGLPVQNNVLIGNAFVNTTDYFGNYGAESFAANSAIAANLYADYGATARLFFDSIGYDAVPKEFTVEIQSPATPAPPLVTPVQTIVTAGMIGDLAAGTLSGASQAIVGQAFNDAEVARSANNIVMGRCQAIGTITTTNPRVPGGLLALIPLGRSGTLKFKVGGAVGLLLTSRTSRWGGIRTLHKTATVATSLTIPIFTPDCPAL